MSGVPSENVEVVRRMYEAFYEGLDDGDFEKALSHFDPNVLVDASTARPDVGIGKGREYVQATVASWVASWDEWREEIEEMRDLGGRVLVLSVQRGRGKGSGAPIEARYALLYDVHGDKITSMRMFMNVPDALEAAGVSD